MRIIRSVYMATTGNQEGFPDDPYRSQYFSDVPSSHPQYVCIQKMAHIGITSGCRTGEYCLDTLNYTSIVTFVVRARVIRGLGGLSPCCLVHAELRRSVVDVHCRSNRPEIDGSPSLCRSARSSDPFSTDSRERLTSSST